MNTEDVRWHAHPSKRKEVVLLLVSMMFAADDSLCLVPSRSDRYLAGTRNPQPSCAFLQFVPQNGGSETRPVNTISLPHGEDESSVGFASEGRRWCPGSAAVEGSNDEETSRGIHNEDDGFGVDRFVRPDQQRGVGTSWNEDSSLESLTRELVDFNQSNNTPGSWTVEDFRRLENAMNAWSRQFAAPDTRPAVQQEQLLRRVIEEKLAGNPLALNLKMGDMYNAVVSSWSKSFESGAPERAEEILDAMQSAYNSGEDEDLKPTIQTWNNVLAAHSLSYSKNSPLSTMRVLSKLYQLLADGKTDVKPNQESYATILKAHAYVGGSKAPKHVLKILRRMQELSDAGYSSVKPDTSCHNVYLKALVNSMEDRPKAAHLAESYLREMMEDPDPLAGPDRLSFCLVLTALSKSGESDASTKAEALVAEMDEMCGRTSPDTSTYNCLIACYRWSNKDDRALKSLAVLKKMKTKGQSNPACRPDCVTFNSVMNCIVKSNDKDAPYKVEALLEEMNEIYETTGDDSVRPTKESYNCCLDAWASSADREAPQRILNWIKRWEFDFESGKIDVPTNTFTYNCYLQALAKQRRPFVADEAERILQLMMDRSHQLKPDVMAYTNVLHCIALSGSDCSFQRAYAILSKMEDGDGDIRPNSYTYNVLVNVIAKSKLPGKAKIALRMVGRMKEVAIRPMTMTYNNVLNACAYSDRASENRKEILDIAFMVLNEAQNTDGANFITYTSYIRVIRYFVDDRLERWQLIRDTFRRCCTDGQLTPKIMIEMKLGITPRQYDLLMKEATDVRTGLWRDEYTQRAIKLKSEFTGRKRSVQRK